MCIGTFVILNTWCYFILTNIATQSFMFTLYKLDQRTWPIKKKRKKVEITIEPFSYKVNF